VIALLRAIGLVDEFVVFDEVRIPLIGFAAEEAIEAMAGTCSLKPDSEMVFIPGGEFTMGSDRHYPEEAP
jgi:formylglycine-generating enzyme required for sulfatase activity